jgi:hypothetical protein
VLANRKIVRENATGKCKFRRGLFASSQTSAYSELADEGGRAADVKSATRKRKNARTHFVDITHQAYGDRMDCGCDQEDVASGAGAPFGEFLDTHHKTRGFVRF